MTALDNAAIFGEQKVPRLKLGRISLVGATALAAATLVAGTILIHGFSENGFRLGSQTGWRFASLVFFAALVAGPLGRILGRFIPASQILAQVSRKLIWAFCASYAVYLVAVLVPNAIQLSGGATVFVLFGAGMTIAMALTAGPIPGRESGQPLMGERTRRTVLGLAVMYFWASYALIAAARITGPHRPDNFYGISLSLMLVALLLRFADRWLKSQDPAPIVAR
jgi:hypothetical protein